MTRYINIAALTLLCSPITNFCYAAALEINKQSILPFFEQGNYAELTYIYAKPTVNGSDILGNTIDNIVKDFDYPVAAVKIAPSLNTRLALIYQKPWGMNESYQGKNLFSTPFDTTKYEFDSKNLTFLAGAKNQKDIWLYGGFAVEKIDSDFIFSSYTVTGIPFSYRLNSDSNNTSIAPIIGIGYEKPSLSLKTSLTYRGAMHHSVNNNESFQMPTEHFQMTSLSRATVTMPQSVNLDFQTGLSEKYKLIGSVNARWVNWKQYDVNPTLYSTIFGDITNGTHLTQYNNNGYAVEVALAKELSPKFAAEIRGGYDSGTGSLGSYDGMKSLALGTQYKFTPQIAIAGGIQYSWLTGGDIKKGGQTIAKVENSNAIGYGVKYHYHF